MRMKLAEDRPTLRNSMREVQEKTWEMKSILLMNFLIETVVVIACDFFVKVNSSQSAEC